MPGRLEGRTALITGAASGIGREAARLFAAEGAKVVVADREDLSKVEAAVLDLARAGFTVRRILDFIPEPDSEIYRALESLSDRAAISF